ncbi:Ig-like domain-containing protein [Variovorax terrae]|uniref:Ig-like domain-containing protein n=1 Tax=Variovorax terrae TaxID=2923278 RepID=A0A9X2ASR5_9BURK|nr:Ig-like domain-containing protein [Variovorax terrae]MCJ0765651.1 Ig-like domain-containing protein [Variovorax terrae]
MHHSRNRHLLALALSLGLAACGGSDGIAPFGPVSSTPANGATGVARNVQPSATFNQSLNAASITATTAQLLSPLGLPLPVTLSASGAVLSMAPVAAALPGGTTYTLALAAGLQSASGAVLGTALSSTFSTAAQQWSGVAQVSDASANALNPVQATDASGNVTAVWQQDTNGTNNVVKASRYSGGSWSAPALLSTAALGAAVNPVVAVDAAGNVTAVWRQFKSASNYGINASRYSNGSWSAPVRVDNVPGNAVSPALVVDAAGNLTAAWQQSNGTRVVINASRYSNGAWSVPVQVDAPSATGDAMAAVLAVDAAGNVTASWNQYNGSNYVINTSRYSNGGWSAPVQLNSATGDAFYPALAVDGAGTVTAAWWQHIGTRDVINASRYSGGNWSAPVQVDAPNATGNARTPALAVDAAGNVTAAWHQVSGAYYVINASRYRNGSWSPPTQVSGASATGDAINAALAVDVAGNLSLAWTQYDGTRFAANASRFGNGSWSAPTELDIPAATSNAISPVLGVDATGNVTATWYQGSPGTYVINARRLQ